MRPPRRTDRYERALTWTGIVALLLGIGWCSNVLGTGRATVADVRAVSTQVAERCGPW